MPTVFHKTVGEIENIRGCIHQLETEIIPSNIAFLEEQMVILLNEMEKQKKHVY